MNLTDTALLDYRTAPAPYRNGTNGALLAPQEPGRLRPYHPPNAEFLRQVAWEVGEQQPAAAYVSAFNHVGLAMVTPYEGFAHWHLRPEWVDQMRWQKGDAWHHCQMVLRLYDVSHIEFNGLNAHRIQDHALPALAGQLFFHLPRPGTWQLAEVGFLLRNGEFLPAARSQAVAFAADTVSARGDHTALLVDENGRVEEVGNVWDQERVLRERRTPKLRKPLQVAIFSFESLLSGQEGGLARFVTELAAGLCGSGHQVHVFVPASDALRSAREADGVRYEPLEIGADDSPLERALEYARAAERRLQELPPFDLIHLQDWMTGLAPWIGARSAVLTLSSIEAVRRNGTTPTPLSLEVQQTERQVAHAVDCILAPDWLRDLAVAELGVDGAHVHAFPLEGKLPDEWHCPLDYGQVKKEIGLGPLDRLMLFIGPLEHAAGPDLLLEALPVLLQRAGNLRLAFIGGGPLSGQLEHRAHQLGVAWAVRLLGHQERPFVTRLMRAAEALMLPSRFRVPFDDAVVDLARRAGRPVVTTHGGPAHLVRHGETGLITYDNPGSMVWAVDRILHDPGHAEQMGLNGKRTDGSSPSWGDVTRLYLELCTASFPELTEMRG